MWEFVIANIDGILAAVAAAHVLAVAVVNLTPTPKDDAAVAAVYKYVEMAAGLFTARAKEQPAA